MELDSLRVGDLVRIKKIKTHMYYSSTYNQLRLLSTSKKEEVSTGIVLARLDLKNPSDMLIILYEGSYVAQTDRGRIMFFRDEAELLNRIKITLKQAISQILSGELRFNILDFIQEQLKPDRKEVYAGMVEQSAIRQLSRERRQKSNYFHTR